jgi:hypothetical protein
MRASATILALLFVTGTLAAQEASDANDSRPDYSRESLLQMLHAQAEEEKKEPAVKYHVGAVEFRAFGSRWRFNYLPILTPLSGTRVGVTSEWPDPFSLSGTSIAISPRTWHTQREIDAEMRRINATEKKKVKIKINAH